LGLFALLLLAPEMANAATPLSKTASPAKKEWVLGISRFSQTSPERLGAFSDLNPALAELSALASADKEGGLSISLPSLLVAGLSPLPPRFDESPEGQTTVSLLKNGEDGSLINLKTLKNGSNWKTPELSSLDGFISGLYSLRGNNLAVTVFCYENGQDNPVSSVEFSGEISSFESFAETVLPGILSWVALKQLGLIDVGTAPPGASLTDKSEEPAGKGHIIDKSRIFIFDKAGFSVGISKNGYMDSALTIDGAKMFGKHTTLRVELIPSAGKVSPAADWASGSPESLNWKDKPEFIQKEKRFYSALGRFVISLPFSVISAGTFFLYSEAYSRAVASSGAVYTSGAVMTACVSVSAGFIVDSVIRFIQVLQASR